MNFILICSCFVLSHPCFLYNFSFFSMHFLSLFLLQVITCFFFSSSLKHQVTHIRPNIITYTKPQRTKFMPDFFKKRISQLLEKLCNKLLHKIFKISPIQFLQLQLFKTGKKESKVYHFKNKKMKCSFFLKIHRKQIDPN